MRSYSPDDKLADDYVAFLVSKGLAEEAAAAAGVRQVIHVSSLAAMGPSPDAVPLREDATPRPLTHYGKSKLLGEQAVQRSPLSTRAIVIRPPLVYGPRDVDVTNFQDSDCSVTQRPRDVTLVKARRNSGAPM